MNKKTKTTLNTLVFLSIGIALFYWAISKVGIEQLVSDIKDANYQWIALAMVCGVLSHLGRSLRWNLLLEPMGYKASEAASFHAVIIGYLVNMVAPRVGEVTRPAVLSRAEDIPFNKLVGTVVVERIVDLLITILIAVVIFFVQFHFISDFVQELMAGSSTQQLLLYGLVVLAVLTVFILAIVYRRFIYRLPIISRFKEFLEGVVQGIQTILSLKRKGLFIFYSLFIWVMYFMMPFLVFFALEGTAHLGVSAGLTVLLFGTFAMIVPVPGGLGTFEVIVPAALALYGIAEGVGETYAVLTHAVQVLLILVVGLFSVLYFAIKTRKKKRNEVE